MKAVRKWQGLATLGAVLSLAVGALALAPSASLAATHSCGSHTVNLEIAGEPGQPKTKYKFPVKQIITQGVSCESAYKVISALYSGVGKGKPDGYKCTVGKFKVPAGKVAEQCTKPGKKIQFAGQGG
jgi:hypothetical protein